MLSFAGCMRDCMGAASDLLQELFNHVLDGDDAQWLALRHTRKVGLLWGNTGRGLQWVPFFLLAHPATASLAGYVIGQDAHNTHCCCKGHKHLYWMRAA